MGFSPITIKGKTVYIHSAVSRPEFDGDTVLADDPWDYVALWLRRDKNKEAGFYWNQSREFYKASIELSTVASPLTSYYCFLNAAKALLTQRRINVPDKHGVSGTTNTGKKCLSNEMVKFEKSGVLSSLCDFLHESIDNQDNCYSFSLREIFYNLPFLHRAFKLTYKSQSTRELFIPIRNPRFVRKNKSKEAWFAAEVDSKYVSCKLNNILPCGYEVDEGIKNCCLIRKKKRFDWIEGKNNLNSNLGKLVDYHRKIRQDVVPILSLSNNSWYLKKDLKANRTPIRKLSQLLLIFGAMHKLSELSRYDPITLAGHFDAQHNWLLTEFLQVAPAQFINHVACEITGQEFVKPHAARLPSLFN